MKPRPEVQQAAAATTYRGHGFYDVTEPNGHVAHVHGRPAFMALVQGDFNLTAIEARDLATVLAA